MLSEFVEAPRPAKCSEHASVSRLTTEAAALK
jgi:hypothetical protein